jgi:hypothetical protein
MNLEDKLPTNLDEVVDMIIAEIQAQKVEKEVTEEGIPHHGAGTSIRNRLHLWWHPSWKTPGVSSEGKLEEVATPKPPLVQWFHNINIYHADDMSGTITAAVQAKLKGEPFDVHQHIQRYFKHWRKYGYEDGIFKPSNL